MANDLSIDSLSIEIQASGDAAMRSLDAVIAKLQQLKQATSGGLTGVSSITKGLNKIADAVKAFNSVDASKFSATISALKKLKDIGNIGDLSNTVVQVRNMKKIADTINAMPVVPAEKLQSIRDMSAALSTLSTLPQLPNLSGTMRSLSQLPTVAAALSAVDMRSMSNQIRSFANALQPLSTIGRSNLSGVVNALRRLPEVSASLATLDMGQFSSQMQTISFAIAPFVDQMDRLGNAFAALPAPIRNAIGAMGRYNTTADQSSTSTSRFGNVLKTINFAGMIAAMRTLSRYMSSWITSSNAYVENLNLFTVAMGDAADEALKFGQRVNEVMGIDISQWVQNQGLFKQLVSGFGMVEDKANLVSQNMTQLGYDISSYFNISISDAMQKLQSGLSGEIEPLRRLGYAIDAATLQQTAYNHGIEMSVENMSQAQKAQLRYITIMEQSTNVMGDMARTIESPANQIRILQSRLETLARTAGDALMPAVSALLPYVTAAVQLLGEALRAMADFMGFELPVFDYSSVVSKSNQDVAASFEDATAAAKEFKGTLSSIDQLNIIGSTSESGGSGGDGGSMFDLDLDLPSYDFLGGLEAKTSEAYEQLKQFARDIQPLIAAIIGAFAGYGLVKAGDFFTRITTSVGGAVPILYKFAPLMISLGTALGVLVGFKNSISNLIKGTGNLGKNIGFLTASIIATVGAIAAFIAAGNPMGAVIVGVGAALGILLGAIEGVNDANEKLKIERITAAFERGITPIEDVAAAMWDVSDAMTASETQYLTAQEGLSGIQESAKTAAGEIQTYIDTITGVGFLTEGEIDKIKLAFEELASASKQYVQQSNENFKLYILANQDMLRAQGFSIETMVNIINNGTENALSEIDTLKARADELVDIQASVGLDVSQIAELENINRRLLELSGVEVDFGINATEAQNILNNLSSIKFTDAETAAQGMQSAFDAVAKAFSTLQTAETDMLSQIDWLSVSESEKKELRDAVTSLFDAKELGLIDMFSPAIRNIINQAEGVGLTVRDAIAKETAGNGILSLDFLESAVTGTAIEEINERKVKEQLGDYYTIITNPYEAFETTLATSGVSYELADKLYNGAAELGTDMTAGLANGITEGTENVTSAITAVANEAEQAFRTATDTHSPSKLYESFGGYLMEGLANGISANTYQVVAIIDQLTAMMEMRMMKLHDITYKELPNYTTEDFDTAVRGNWSMSRHSSANTVAENDPRAIMEFFQIGNSASDSDTPIDITIHHTTELDGDVLAENTARYAYRNAYANNGTS